MTRDTPPSIQDGPLGYEPDQVDYLRQDQAIPTGLAAAQAQKLGRSCYDASTSWLNSGRRAQWTDSLRAFNSQHPSGSKYLSRDYSYRSNLYRPKTRATVRKNEAQTASAFFSNEDVVSVQAEDDDDPVQQASAKFMQALLQYRLTKTIPWFQTIVGARQDAEILGICVAKAYWDYEEEFDHTERRAVTQPDTGEVQLDDDGFPMTETVDVMRKVKDEPRVDLISPENIRFEPGCDWRDPIKSSPYVIELMPLYVQEVRERIADGEWFPVSDGALHAATDIGDDTTRRAREQGRVPGKDTDVSKPREFDICWVRNNIIRWGGQDWQFYTLNGAGEMLSDPRPLKEVYLHGCRPYVCGSVVLETHKTYPSGKPELTRDLQRASNDDWNLRFDILKLTLNPRQFVKLGAGIDINDVRSFMPGKVVLVKDPQTDIQWDRPPGVAPEAYAEQDRINLDWDDLVGDFTNSSVQASQIQQQSATGMNLMSGQASGMPEYELRMFAETFVERLLRLLVKIEQTYETDPVILAIAGKNAQIVQKFGVSEQTDDLLAHELTVRVNVGIGATNPQMKLKNFVDGADILSKMFGPSLVQGVNFEEVSKEVFGFLGYKDGQRFFTPQFDPRVAALQQQVQELQGKIKQPAQSNAPPQVPPSQDPRLLAAQMTGQFALQKEQLEMQRDRQQQQADLQEVMFSENAQTQRDRQKYAHDAGVKTAGLLHDTEMAARAPQPTTPRGMPR